jgi:nucleoside-diphosphate-sugar epimerase
VDLLIAYELKNKKNIRIDVAARKRQLFDEKYRQFPFVEYVEYNALKDINFPDDIDFIIHGAGSASPERYVNYPVETMLTGINGTEALLKYCSDHNTRRFLFISSSEVYGIKSRENAFTENNYGVINLDSVRSSYPVSKRAAEMLCRSYLSEFGVDTVIVRPGHVFGPSASEKDMRVSSAFAYQAARGKNLVLKSSGLQKRSYMYAPDCAKAILIALLKGASGEAYNIGAETETSIREMAECYAEAGGVELISSEPTTEEIKAFNPMSNATLNIEKIKSLGYNDTICVSDGLIHTVKILRDTM